MIDHHLPPDPELNRLIQASHEMLQAFATALRSSPDAAAHITTALHQASADPQDTAMLKAAVGRLFDEGDWFHALPLATRLLLMAPDDPTASYRLGTCLQRMGQHAQALAVFARCALSEGDLPSPGPLLRMGECMAALGQDEAALNALDACLELARTNPQHAHLQAMATDKANALRLRQ